MLDPGTRLGPYEIVSRIGAGGMGEVFRAMDTRLDRSVAVKVLSSHLSSSPQLRERFDREARAVSALNHPNICTLYDVGHQDGIDYIVMELLDGETLADRLSKGALPLEQVLRLAAQIAGALDKAHRQGIVHRDLKPGNIMLTRSGPKLLDFGLAKSTAPLSALSGTSNLPTEQKPLTQEGTILGTLQYMAPEQLIGEEADARTDIFAFGAVLYEMATGKRAFEAKSKTSLIAQITGGEPRPILEVQPLTPPALEHVIRKCLAKDRDDRWQSASDIAEELRWISETTTASGPGMNRRVRERHVWIVATLLLATLLAASVWRRQRDLPADVRNARVALPLLPGETLPPTSRLILGLSPDGKTVVYTALKGGRWPMYLRRLDQNDPAVIPEVEGGYDPFFSPDGKWLAFFRQFKLWKVPLSGGMPSDLTSVGGARGGSWSADGFLYFARSSSSGIWRIAAAGGAAEEITKPDSGKGENSHRWPQALPDGKSLLMTIRTDQLMTFDDARIAVLSLQTRKWKTVVEGATFGRYVPTGHLIYQRGGSLYAVGFDLDRLEAKGAPSKILEGVRSDRSSGVAQFAVSNQGSLAYIPRSQGDEDDALWWLRPSGERSPVGPLRRHYTSVALSPDQRKIAAVIGAANDDVWLLDIDREVLTRFSFEPGDEFDPVWTPDGQWIVYVSSLGDRGARLLAKRADGTGAPEELLRSEEPIRFPAASPDGKVIAYARNSKATKADIWFLPFDGERKPRPFLQTPFSEIHPRFSPDGKWIAYTSDESGVHQIYVQRVEGGEKWQISRESGFLPVWSADGKAILYMAPGTKLFMVDVRTRPSFVAGKPRHIHDQAPFDCEGIFALARDGSVLTCGPASNAVSPAHINLAFDWFDELKGKMKSRGD